jgi:biotin carboxyl carrier protein
MEGVEMAIKKMLINDTVWTYRLESQVDGLLVKVTHGAIEQTYTITHHTYDSASGRVRWECGGRLFTRVLSQNADCCVVIDPVSGRSVQIRETVPCSGVSTVAPAVKIPHIKSPLAGKVMKICVDVAQSVREDQLLVVIESMKMENEIRSPRRGIIKTIFISVGNVVQQGHIMIEFEKEGVGNAAAKSSHGQTEV